METLYCPLYLIGSLWLIILDVDEILIFRKGEEVMSTYTLTLAGTQFRRKHLRESKYFECKCKRCRDPTELGSHFRYLQNFAKKSLSWILHYWLTISFYFWQFPPVPFWDVSRRSFDHAESTWPVFHLAVRQVRHRDEGGGCGQIGGRTRIWGRGAAKTS